MKMREPSCSLQCTHVKEKGKEHKRNQKEFYGQRRHEFLNVRVVAERKSWWSHSSGRAKTELAMVLEKLPLMTLLGQRGMKDLNSRVCAQVEEVVPPVCWAVPRVLLGRDYVKRLCQSHAKESMDVSKTLGQQVRGFCHVP